MKSISEGRFVPRIVPLLEEPWHVLATKHEKVNNFNKLDNSEKRQVCRCLPLPWKLFPDHVKEEEEKEGDEEADEVEVAAE